MRLARALELRHVPAVELDVLRLRQRSLDVAHEPDRDERIAPAPDEQRVRSERPELGLLQVAPRSVVERMTRRIVSTASDGWAAAGVDEFLRAYLTPRGRAAFYAAARNIYLDEPHGEEGLWTRLEAAAGARRAPSGGRGARRARGTAVSAS